jgi:hypothetical protein
MFPWWFQSPVQRGRVAAAGHPESRVRDPLGSEHPQDVQRGHAVNKQTALVRGGRAKEAHFPPRFKDHELAVSQRTYDAALARGKPHVRHGRGNLLDDLLVGFHFKQTTARLIATANAAKSKANWKLVNILDYLFFKRAFENGTPYKIHKLREDSGAAPPAHDRL